MRRFEGGKLIEGVYRKSILHNREKLLNLVQIGNVKKIQAIKRDPVFKLYQSLRSHFDTEVYPTLSIIESSLEAAMKPYMGGMKAMNAGKAFYPDANSTLRITYGLVEGYEPRDGVKYKHYTTLDGIIEKNSFGISDYIIPDRLRELYEKGDYGIYGKNGAMPVCFIASNHTTGGNSGSPVINAEGHLVGINFDRCWEGTMSDIMYDPDQCRNISLDMRYALFIIDKFAGAGYLIDEMELVH
jgi:hypothetical protein